MSDGTPGASDNPFDKAMHILERLEHGQTALKLDVDGLYQAVLVLQRDVHFFTRRCEERGNIIREFASRLRTDGQVDPDAALEFLASLECAGTPIRPPSAEVQPVLELEDPGDRFDDPTEPRK